MSLADALKRAADAGRRAAAAVAQRPTSVTICVETWTDAVGTEGATYTTAATLLVPAPKLVFQGDQPSVFGDGLYSGPDVSLEAAEVLIGPITPAYPGGGYDAATLAPTPTDARQRVYLLLAGRGFAPGGERYEIVRVDDRRPQAIFVTARRTSQS